MHSVWTRRDMWRLRSCDTLWRGKHMTGGQQWNVLRNAVARGDGLTQGCRGCSRCINEILGYREQRRLCEDGGFTSPHIQSSWQPSCPSPPLARQAPFQRVYTHPFHWRSWSVSPVVLRGWPDVPSPPVQRVCPRCDPSTPGPDAAYPESIITASAPLVCQLRCQAGASEQPANPLPGSGHDSQSVLSFARSDQLKSTANPLTNRMCPACRRTHPVEMWNRSHE